MCGGTVMATNLGIDDNLLVEAQKIGGHKTKKETVTEALKKYIQLHKQLEIIELFDKIDYEPDYDYKQTRFRK